MQNFLIKNTMKIQIKIQNFLKLTIQSGDSSYMFYENSITSYYFRKIHALVHVFIFITNHPFQ